MQLVVGNLLLGTSVENTPFCKYLCIIRGVNYSVAYTTQTAATGTEITSQVQWQKTQISCRLSVIPLVHGSSDLQLL